MEESLRNQLCFFAHRLWDRGLIGGAEGNLSCRLGADRFLATPAGFIKRDLKPEDFVVVDLDGKPIGNGKPSSEIGLHATVYQNRADCNAVIHAHPPTATAFGVAGREIPDDVLPEAGYYLGHVAMVRFAIPGTEDVGEAIKPLLGEHKTFILKNHGAFTLGAELVDAYVRMETLERVAKMLLMAEALGGANKMPREGIEWLQRIGLNGDLG